MPGRTDGKQSCVHRSSRAHCGAPSDFAVYSYASDAGAGSATFAPFGAGRWRSALLGTVAAGVLFLGYARSAKAECGYVGTTVTCTGDIAGDVPPFIDNGGIIIPDVTPPGINTLNVYDLNAPITPGNGTAGIDFRRTVGNAGDVTIDSVTAITTQGDEADGIFAYAGGSGAVSVTHTGDITAPGMDSDGVNTLAGPSGDNYVKVIGNITAGDEGIEARAGDGTITIDATGEIVSASDGFYALANGDVDVTQTGDVTSTGRIGIRAVSDGGAVGVTSSGNINSDREGINVQGLTGVTVDHTGDITSTGNSRGILAQSRANTNNGDAAISGSVEVIQTGDTTAVSGGAAAVYATSTAQATVGGDATTGAVTVRRTGELTATGPSAGGIGAATGAFVGVGGAGTAMTGAVTVIQTGDISTGPGGQGIFASSDATNGGGGAAIAGGVTVIQSGDITTSGANARAILARSAAIGATAMNGNIAITLNGGAIRSAQSDGVEFQNGADNTLTVNNTVFVSGGGGASDVLGAFADETINNYGNLTTPGNIDLGGGTNAFNNFAGATFNSGTIVDLGPMAGNLFTNSGNLSSGGEGNIQTTDLIGDFTQNGGGLFTVDVDFPNTVGDLLNVSGTANLDGSVAVNLVDPQAVMQGSLGTPVTILTAPTINNNGIEAIDTALIDYELLFSSPGPDIMQVGGTVNFVPAGLNRNQTSIASNIQAIQGAGGAAAFTPIVAALLTLPDLPSLQNALDQLSPEAYLDTQIATLYAAMDFSNNLFSCPVSQGQFAFIREGQCVWLEGGGRQLDQDRTNEFFGFDEETGQISGGAQIALGGDWFAGGALGYEWGDFSTDTNVKSDVDRFSGGVALKYNPGPVLLAGAISGGGSWYDTRRNIAFPGFTATARSDHEVNYGSGQLRAAYLLEGGSAYLKPQVDLNATYLDLSSITERNGGGANLNISGTDDWVLSVSPALELGAQMGDEHDLVMVRPYVRAGITAYDDTSFQISSTFTAAPVAPFLIKAETDDLTYDISGGADFFSHGNASLRVAYDGKFGDDVEVHSGSIRGRLGF